MTKLWTIASRVPLGVRRLDRRSSVGRCGRERLLTQDVFACVGTGDEHVAAERLWRAHVDDGDVVTGEQVGGVGVGVGLGQSGQLPNSLPGCRVGVSHGYDPDEIAHFLPRGEVHPNGDVAAPDDADPELVTHGWVTVTCGAPSTIR